MLMAYIFICKRLSWCCYLMLPQSWNSVGVVEIQEVFRSYKKGLYDMNINKFTGWDKYSKCFCSMKHCPLVVMLSTAAH